MSDLIETRRTWITAHLRTYQESDGRAGHIVDLRDMGGREYTTTLLLKTLGRKSGKPSVVPLLYGIYGNEVVIVGSKGGARDHPAWFLNMQEQDEVAFQICEDHFRGPWRVVGDADRGAVWDYVIGLYPPYADYQNCTEREIPVVMLTRRERTEAL